MAKPRRREFTVQGVIGIAHVNARPPAHMHAHVHTRFSNGNYTGEKQCDESFAKRKGRNIDVT